MSTQNPKRILTLCYSFSGQTNALMRHIVEALEERGHTVYRERLEPREPLRFPVGTLSKTLKMMLTTFIRCRVPIQPLSAACFENYDLIILAGPTWSYNPSGPILSLIDRDGRRLFYGKTVLPLISCRGYWRVHWYGLRRLLRGCGAITPNVLVFSHPNKEPWRTIGVFLKIAGRTPEKGPFLGKYYKKFGHARRQLDEAARLGSLIGEALEKDTPLDKLHLHSDIALP